MKTEWDYTELADAYLKRPDYSDDAIEKLIVLTNLSAGARVCDIGAGTGHLTKVLGRRGFLVSAVEPNDAMRSHGISVTRELTSVQWSDGTGESTGQPSGVFNLVTFGSSFNVTNRPEALKETARLLVSQGWFACMWNHRNLKDPIQEQIEKIIQNASKSYDYGSRREDQTEVINRSELFGKVHYIEGDVQHVQSVVDCIEAWRSHATLHRQTGDRFPAVIQEISHYLHGLKKNEIVIPYTTRIWAAQRCS